jgi:hypothetical protein
MFRARVSRGDIFVAAASRASLLFALSPTVSKISHHDPKPGVAFVFLLPASTFFSPPPPKPQISTPPPPDFWWPWRCLIGQRKDGISPTSARTIIFSSQPSSTASKVDGLTSTVQEPSHSAQCSIGCHRHGGQMEGAINTTGVITLHWIDPHMYCPTKHRWPWLPCSCEMWCKLMISDCLFGLYEVRTDMNWYCSLKPHKQLWCISLNTQLKYFLQYAYTHQHNQPGRHKLTDYKLQLPFVGKKNQEL